MNDLTIIILTKNEEENIIDCLENVLDSGQVIVVDDFSTDHTLDAIKNFGNQVKVYKNSLDDDFSSQRNFALKKATTEWALFIDADERLSDKLKKEIIKTVNSDTKYSGFKMKRMDVFEGKRLKYGETKNIQLVRLGRKDAGEWRGKVHETWDIKNVSTLPGELLHFPHKRISEFLSEINFYSTLRAEELYEKKERVNLFSIIFYPSGKLIYNYFVKLGFLDGTHGFVMAVFMSFHSFLVRGKLYLLYNRER